MPKRMFTVCYLIGFKMMTCKKNNYIFGFDDNIYIYCRYYVYVAKKYNIYQFVKCNKTLVKS